MNWYKIAQNLAYGTPIRFINPLTKQEASGIYDKPIDNMKSRVRIGDEVGRPLIVLSTEITPIDMNQELQPGQTVNLINYPTENPATIIEHLGNGQYSVQPKSNRQMVLSISEINVI
jgi:hypothetical protein